MVEISDLELELKKEETKKRIGNFINNKLKILLIFLIIFSISLYFYYFNLTKSQPLWWDEAEYMSHAKHWAFDVPYDINSQRPPLFPFLASLIFQIGLNEMAIRFLLVLFPGILVVFLTYLFIKEVYNEKIALITAFITSVSWIHLFYSMRLMTDSIGLLFGLASFYCFWKGYMNNGNKIYIWLTGFFVSLSIMIRLTGILYGLVILIFLITTDKFKFLKNKHIWISLLISIITISPLLIYDYINFDNPLAFRSGYGGMPDQSLGWHLIKEVYNYSELIFFITFVIGLIITLQLFLTFDLIIKGSEKKYYGDLFMFLSIVIVLAFFIYFLRQAENRWLILMSIGIFSLSAKGLIFIYEKIKKYNKQLAIIILIILLFLGAFYQIKHADFIIKNKKDTYSQIKDASLWIKENSNKDDVILSISYTQTIYYSERKVYTYSEMSQEDFFNLIKETKPRYILISILEPHHPQWIYEWAPNSPQFLTPKQAYLIDKTSNQAAAVIYEFNQDFIDSL